MRPPSPDLGFTLLEVVVALAVIAIALGAAISGGSAQVDNAAHLRERTFAHWVAMNRIAAAELDPAAARPGSGLVEMAGREWRWELAMAPTEARGVTRLEVTVSPAGRPESILARAASYLPEGVEGPP